MLRDPLRLLLAGCLVAVMTGCGAPADGGETVRGAGARTEPASLFSEALHDLPMPAPGFAWVEVFGQTQEVTLSSDCSADTEAPAADHALAEHDFYAGILIRHDESYADISLTRTINTNPDTWEFAAHEQEVVSLTTDTRPEQILHTYSLYRLTPDSAFMISRPLERQAQVATATDPVPGIRVHPDGRRATFVGQLGRSAITEERTHDEFEEIRIAIHCGPV